MTVRILQGDARDVLPTLPADSVHCVVTSPPYFGLRDYGTAQWAGGDAACDHRESGFRCRNQGRDRAASGGTFHDAATPVETLAMQYRAICGKCGARRVDRQLGLEQTPDAYIAEMVAVFREVRRVLRPDGTCWVNIGDSYSSGSGGDRKLGVLDENRAMARSQIGAKPKDLMLMPARLALALQADGWWIRSDIIWAKPNPMPESVTDRPTSAHEHVFLLTKASRYYYDAQAVAEPCSWGDGQRVVNVDTPKNRLLGLKPTREYGHELMGGRNLRNVWTIATEAFPGSHFATYPTELVSRCIRAGTSEKGACPMCGAPWYRVVNRSLSSDGNRSPYALRVGADENDQGQNRYRDGHVPG